MTRILRPILKGSLLCAVALGMTACSDTTAPGSRQQDQEKLKPEGSTPTVKGEEQSTATARAAFPDGETTTQDMTPIDQIGMSIVGFHALKDDPTHQMTAYHFCQKLPDDMIQCLLYSDNTKDARMTGIEYIVSDKVYASLSEDERKFWHPHNYEILSGQLVAPGMSDTEELALMTQTLNSYGKTFHMWNKEDALPMGEPKLGWSITKDGQVKEELVRERDEKLGIDTKQKQENRASLKAMATEQEGVDVFEGARMGMPVEQPVKGQSTVTEEPMKDQTVTEEPVKDQTITSEPVKGQVDATPMQDSAQAQDTQSVQDESVKDVK